MFIDTSALVAILNEEPEKDLLLYKIEQSRAGPHVSAVTVLETVALYAKSARKSDADPVTAEILEAARQDVADLLEALGAKQIGLSGNMSEIALDYAVRYGKGRHPAGLTLGDCLSAACARAYHMPLLYAGKRFDQTDLA